MRAWNTSLSCARADDGGILDLTQNRLAGIVLSTILAGASSNLLHRGEVRQAIPIFPWTDQE